MVKSYFLIRLTILLLDSQRFFMEKIYIFKLLLAFVLSVVILKPIQRQNAKTLQFLKKNDI